MKRFDFKADFDMMKKANPEGCRGLPGSITQFNSED